MANVTTDLTSLRELLETIAREQRYYENFEVALTPVTNGATSFSSQLFTATISSPNKADLQLFVKAVLADAFQQFDVRPYYAIEHKFFTDIARTYDKIQDKYDVKGEERLVFPKFYGVNLKSGKIDVLILEDLTASGFTCYDRLKAVDWKYAARAVEELAKLHALSLAYGKEYPDQYQELITKLKFLPAADSDQFDGVWGNMLSTTLELTRDDNRDKLRQYIEEQGGKDLYMRYTKPLRCPVLVHGDFKFNNLMHKVCNDGEIEIAIIDYQMLHAGSIPEDLMYFMFTSTDREFRGRHMARLVEHYYASLRRALRLRGVRAHHVYPREDFDYEMKTFLPFGLALAVTSLSVLLVDQAETKLDANTTIANLSLQLKPNKVYQERLNGIVDDYVEWGVL